MKGHGIVQVYSQLPFAHGFQKVLNEVGLYHGSVKEFADVVHDVENTDIDMVVIGTCELEYVDSFISNLIIDGLLTYQAPRGSR